MKAARFAPALAAGLATACFFSASALADVQCNVGPARAGVVNHARVRGIRATLAPLTAPYVKNGYAKAWVGVGRRAWIHVGLRSSGDSSASHLFYELKRADGTHRNVLFNRLVQPGHTVSVGVRKWPYHPRLWRVYVDGHPVTKGIRLNRRRLSPAATAEALNTVASTCNRFSYDFKHVKTKTFQRSPWRAMPGKKVVQDLGYEVVQQSPEAFVAKSTGDPGAFAGDFESGDRHQWDRIQVKSGGNVADQFEVVADPVRQGAFAAKFTVRPGDVFMSGGERSEVVWYSGETEGNDYWYNWSTLFPKEWTAPSYFGIFFQWHSGLPHPPPISFDARDNTAQVKFNTGVIDPATGRGTMFGPVPLLPSLAKGQWNDFLVHVHWSLTDGSLTVWHRTNAGDPYAKVLDLANIPTMQAKDGVTSPIYAKQGLYRWTDANKTDVIYQDDFHRASALGGFGLVETESGELVPDPAASGTS